MTRLSVKYKKVKEEILKFFKGEVEDNAETLTAYSHDASLLEIRPKVVAFPKNSEDVKNLVKWVNENKQKGLSITPRCAGTDMSGGAIGESIILDFTRHMNHLIDFSDSKKITVEPGMFYRDFEKITLEKGLILPCYTASKSLNALGGMFGNNSAGERTLKYGQMENYILESKVVFADGNEYIVKPLNQEELNKKIAQGDFEGNVYKNIFNLIKENEEEIKHAKPNVSKNSSGYYIWNVIKDQSLKNSFALPASGLRHEKNFLGSDLNTVQNSSNFLFDLNKLLVGSQGTLGIVTEMTLKLVVDNKHSKLVAIFMNDIEPLGRLVKDILSLNPETLETYDDKTMKLAVRFFPDFLKNKGFVGMFKFLWSFLPEAFLMSTSGFPKLFILAEFAGRDEAEANTKCERLKDLIKNYKLKIHITKSETEADKYWDIRRESFALLRKHVRGMRTAPFIDDIIVRPEFLPKFLPDLNNVLSKYDLMFTLAGHAGDGNFHIIPLMDFKKRDTAKIIIELGEKVYDLVIKYHGSITAEHNDGLVRTPYLKKMFGDRITQIFSKTKEIFDPQNILNPGKKVPVFGGPGTRDYLASHVAVEHDAKHTI